ncbi:MULTISPECIES: efflux transporter outer membrane subunit [unclassified Sphingomonas]|uniref:efflux transporter outer membrane subunit n=1 Tax=unclassified Sphingomonas TaxID=196159 RepID=UPI002269F793|nr:MULTISPECIES: efflux transporter outer membrane subunit [unclassified Sphingomonas]
MTRSFTRFVTLLGCATAIAGCTTVGPNYHRPGDAVIEKPTAQGAFVGGSERAYALAPVPNHWWHLYNDPQLDRLVDEALTANTDLRIATANIARAQASLDLAEDNRRPQFGITAAPGYAQRSAEEELLPGAALPSSFVYAASGSVSYQLDLVGQVRRAIEAADADVAATQAARDSVRITVAADTTRAYLDACSAGREIGVAQRALDLQSRTTALTQRLVRGGRGISLDATRSQAQESQVRATMPALRAAKQLALYRLATLTGRPPAEFDRSVAACTAEPHLAQAIPIGDGAALLKRRPDVRRAELELHAATARIGVATAELYPQVSLGASVGSVGLADRVLGSDTFKFSLGPLIHWDFPNRGRVRARIAASQAEADADYARFDGVVLGALRETESALTVYARDLDRTADLRAARGQAAKAAADAETLFRAGRTSFLPVLDAQRTLIGADQMLAAQQTRLATDQVQLFLALGGGWQA